MLIKSEINNADSSESGYFKKRPLIITNGLFTLSPQYNQYSVVIFIIFNYIHDFIYLLCKISPSLRHNF
ncbi:hypothetical protein [Staphylococcus phage phi575]|nr:hypothetical protein [Staphylococcus phage phi575]